MTVTPDPVRAIAQAVLYEGYVLWPHRRDALKNRRRWSFGGILPRAWHEADHPDDRCMMRCEVLACARPGAAVAITFRWLHVVERRVARASADGLELVDAPGLPGERHVSREEATEREVTVSPVPLRDGEHVRQRITIRRGSATEWLERRGQQHGGLVRSWRQLRGHVDVSVREIRAHVFRVRVDVLNDTAWAGDDREGALRASFNSSHVVLRATHADFVSLTDPPESLAEAAEACDNIGCWPVLVGPPRSRDTMLAAPIILSDHPSIAPARPGDLFDGGEIDERAVLNILGLSDREKDEKRAADPRRQEMLERTALRDPAQPRHVHGTLSDAR